LAQRARIVLLAADGVSNTVIAERVGASRATVVAWRARYSRNGIAGLADEQRPGRPRVIDHEATVCGSPRTKALEQLFVERGLITPLGRTEDRGRSSRT
jgi:transposase